LAETTKSKNDSKKQVKEKSVDEKVEKIEDISESVSKDETEVKNDIQKQDDATGSSDIKGSVDVSKKSGSDKEVEKADKTSPKESSEEKVEEVSSDKPSEEKVEKTSPDVSSEEKEIPISKKNAEDKKSKKETSKKKDQHKDDFRYIVRIANTDIDGEKKIVYGISEIKGVGVHLATLISNEAKLDKSIKMGNLSDSQIEEISQVLDRITEIAPSWMLNHRKDIGTGDDIHLIGSEIDLRHRDEINVLKKIRSYRGIRHEMGLRVRGQRTKANNRSGLTLGVSRKSVKQGK